MTVEYSDTLRRDLLKLYAGVLSPAALILGCWAVCKNMGGAPIPDPALTAIIGPAVFISAVVAALALPLAFRARFVHRVGNLRHADAEEFRSFQRMQTVLPLLATYPAAMGYVFGVSNFHFAGAFLAALYAAYYYFPSETRVRREMRLFRVAQVED